MPKCGRLLWSQPVIKTLRDESFHSPEELGVGAESALNVSVYDILRYLGNIRANRCAVMIMSLAQHHKSCTAQNVIALPVKIATPKVSHYFLRDPLTLTNPLRAPIEA
ncbi:hypothetical protein ASG42_11625 [Rhizobium sp. Leaf391]|nr:hypothetical protein ASG42_11625 [Rhizobium sp. Leaf391]